MLLCGRMVVFHFCASGEFWADGTALDCDYVCGGWCRAWLVHWTGTCRRPLGLSFGNRRHTAGVIPDAAAPNRLPPRPATGDNAAMSKPTRYLIMAIVGLLILPLGVNLAMAAGGRFDTLVTAAQIAGWLAIGGAVILIVHGVIGLTR